MKKIIGRLTGAYSHPDYYSPEAIDVMKLIRKAKLERKKEKRKSIFYFAAGIVFVTAAGLVITL